MRSVAVVPAADLVNQIVAGRIHPFVHGWKLPRYSHAVLPRSNVAVSARIGSDHEAWTDSYGKALRDMLDKVSDYMLTHWVCDGRAVRSRLRLISWLMVHETVEPE